MPDRAFTCCGTGTYHPLDSDREHVYSLTPVHRPAAELSVAPEELAKAPCWKIPLAAVLVGAALALSWFHFSLGKQSGPHEQVVVRVRAPGVWKSLGNNTACHLTKGSAQEGHDVAESVGYPVETIAACQVICANKGNCHGIEFNEVAQTCMIWTAPVAFAIARQRFTCLSFVPVDEDRESILAPANVWLTTVNHNASPAGILKKQPTVKFHHGAKALFESDFPAATFPIPKSATQDANKGQNERRECLTVHGVYTWDCKILPDDNPDKKRWASRTVEVLVDAADIQQTIAGFGSAMTQASAEILHGLKERDADLYEEVMQRLFGLCENCAGISIVRVPIGSSESASHAETFDDNENDWSLSKFALAEHDKIIAVLKDAKATNPCLMLMGSPWTAPAWLKTNKTLQGQSPANTLIDSDMVYETYARYLARAVRLFHTSGLLLTFLTLQNEPLWGWAKSPGMYLSAEQYARLGTEVKKRVGETPKLLTYDDNWDHPEFPIASIVAAPDVFAGTAWHCYGGDMTSAQDTVHAAFPTLEMHVTECTSLFPNSTCDIKQGLDNFGWEHEWDMRRVLLGATTHWAQSGIKWMMVADENCGPVLPGVAFQWGRPMVSVPSNAKTMNDIRFHQDFWSVAHMARFVRPGAQRVLTVKRGQSASIMEAFKDDSSGTVTLIAINEDHSYELPLKVSSFGFHFEFTLPKWSTAVIVWQM